MKTAIIAGAIVATIATISIIAALAGGDGNSSNSNSNSSSDDKPAGAVNEPNQIAEGTRVTPEGSSLSFVIPSGWKSGWVREASEEVYAVEPTGGQHRGTVFATARPLDAAERATTIDVLLRNHVGELLRGATSETVFGPTKRTSNGNQAGQLIVRVEDQGKRLEGNAAAVIIDGWAIVFLGVYEVSGADVFRPAVETMLSTLEGKPPTTTAGNEPGGSNGTRADEGGSSPGGRSIIGCWEYSYSSGGMSTTRIAFDADGTYDYYHYTSIGGATNESSEQGRFTVTGNAIGTTANDGTTGSYTVEWDRAIPYLNGTRYLRCSG